MVQIYSPPSLPESFHEEFINADMLPFLGDTKIVNSVHFFNFR